MIISGGNVLAKGGAYSAGIGGGGLDGRTKGGEGADVTISGGTVITMRGKDGFAQAIGRSTHGSSKELSISTGLTVNLGSADDMDVYSFADALAALENKPCASASDRISESRGDCVLIMPCQNHRGSYFVNTETHTHHCVLCDTETTNAHSFDDDQVCTVCGYTYYAATCNISFDPNGGGGTMEDVQVLSDRTFYLTLCSFTPPSEKTVFAGWMVGEDTTVMEVGTEITVSGDLTLKAVWYSIIQYDDSKNGYVTAGSNAAAAGSMVTLTSYPEDGYGAASVTVHSDGIEIPCNLDNDGTYTFQMPESSVQVTAVFQAVTPVFAKESVSPTGRIGLNFFMELPEIEGVDYSTSYMKFSIIDQTERVDFDPDFRDPETNLYGFTCPLSCLEMGEPITAVFHYGTDGTVTKIPSLEQCILYYNTLYEEDSNLCDADTAAFLRAMADYGYYMQIYLSERDGWTIGEDYMSMGLHYTESYDIDEVLEAVEDSALVLVNNGSAIESVSCDLAPGTDTSILLYLQPEAGYTGTLTVTVDGEPYAAEPQADGRYLVTIPELHVQQLDTVFKVEAVTNSGSATVDVSALSYVHQILSTSDNSDAKNAAAALYYYANSEQHVAEEKVPEFKAINLILSGQIGMHFIMSIPEGTTGGTMEFTVGKRTATAEGVLQSDGRYKFTCYITSVEMAEMITAEYTYTVKGETKTVTTSSSVKDYLETIINMEAYTAAAPLAKAIYNYGYYAMKAVPGGSKHTEMPDTYADDDALITSLEGYQIKASLDDAVITAASYSLDLDSETAINFYLTTDNVLTSENVSVTSNASFKYTVEKVGSRYRVQITGIGAHELGTEFTLSTEGATITASALTYVQQTLSDSNADLAAKKVSAALYEYYDQAIKYMNNVS